MGKKNSLGQLPTMHEEGRVSCLILCTLFPLQAQRVDPIFWQLEKVHWAGEGMLCWHF